MSAHTPGPWTYGVRKDGSIWLSLGNHLDLEAAHYQGDLVGTEADARLIAAAPDLLEAATKALNLIEDLSGHYADESEEYLRCVDAAANLGVVILKAEGR